MVVLGGGAVSYERGDPVGAGWGDGAASGDFYLERTAHGPYSPERAERRYSLLILKCTR